MISKPELTIIQKETANDCGIAEFSCDYKDTALTVRITFTTDSDYENEHLKELRIRRVDRWPVAEIVLAAIIALREALVKPVKKPKSKAAQEVKE